MNVALRVCPLSGKSGKQLLALSISQSDPERKFAVAADQPVAIASHRGRIVKTTGDGMLVEFASAVDAVRSSADVQRKMAEQNTALPQDQRIELRIGIHVGDIIVNDNDIFGDGVNIAARLEAIAEPGGIYRNGRAQS